MDSEKRKQKFWGYGCHEYFSAEKSLDPTSRRRAPALRSFASHTFPRLNVFLKFGEIWNSARRRGWGRNAGG